MSCYIMSKLSIPCLHHLYKLRTRLLIINRLRSEKLWLGDVLFRYPTDYILYNIFIIKENNIMMHRYAVHV